MDATIAYIGRVAEARIAWVSKARCRVTDPDQFFVRGAAQRKAADICRHCLVIAECLAYALGNEMEFGVWGGLTERQRRALLKQHPEVAKFFAAQCGPTRVDQGGPRKGLQGQPIRAAAKRAKAMANSAEANECRREREPHVIDWDKAIANLLEILNDIYDERRE
jgi:WhiB family transcriptional regulator, redox-sensing transcriptional regulator